MALKLYGHQQSPFVRPVLMLLETLGTSYEFVFVDLFKGEHKTAEFAKVSPRQIVPALIDESSDIRLNESKAILIYLASKYDKDRRLYPEKVEEQAKILEKLFFDTNDFGRAFFEVFVPLAFRGETSINEAKVANLKKVLSIVEEDLSNTNFVAGTKDLSIADLSMLSIFTTMKCSGKTFVDFNEYPKLNEWAERCIPLVANYEKANGKGLEIFDKFFKEKVPKDLQKF